MVAAVMERAFVDKQGFLLWRVLLNCQLRGHIPETLPEGFSLAVLPSAVNAAMGDVPPATRLRGSGSLAFLAMNQLGGTGGPMAHARLKNPWGIGILPRAMSPDS